MWSCSTEVTPYTQTKGIPVKNDEIDILIQRDLKVF